MMPEKKEALYLVDHESYLHLKETVTQTGFAYETFDKATGAAQHTGLITYEEMLENPIRNLLACTRVMALEEIGLKGEVVSEVALRTLDQIKEARRAYRKEHPEDPHDHSIRFITSDYEELLSVRRNSGTRQWRGQSGTGAAEGPGRMADRLQGVSLHSGDRRWMGLLHL